MVIRLALAALLCVSWPAPVLAAPARIIILRHGEKADKWKLCDIAARTSRRACRQLSRPRCRKFTVCVGRAANSLPRDNPPYGRARVPSCCYLEPAYRPTPYYPKRFLMKTK